MVNNIKPEYIYILKILALKGGTQHYVNISSSELGKILSTSQQTASRKILYLLNNGYIIKQGDRFLVSNKGLEFITPWYKRLLKW